MLFNASYPKRAEWCDLDSNNDDRLLLKKISIKMLYKFIKNLPQDNEKKYLMQAEIVFKVFLDCISSNDK
jgi:hypothetical protein